MLPTTIVITGAPGSGKSELGRQLSRELRIPFLARDDIRGGLAFTAGAWTERLEDLPSASAASQMFLDTVTALSRAGVSCVVEYVVRRHRPEEFERLCRTSSCKVIITSADDWLDRYRKRNDSDSFIANLAVLDHLNLSSPEEHTESSIPRMLEVASEMETDFSVPALKVDTTDGWSPSIERIIRFATT